MELAGFQVSGVQFDRNQVYFGFLHNYSSINTRQAYLKDLKLFLKWLSERFPGVNEIQVDHAHMVAFKEFLLAERYAQRSVNRALATMRAFYEHLSDLELVDRNPVARVKRFKIGRDVKTLDLSNDEVMRMLEIVKRPLHKALLNMYFTTGMRHREVTTLKIKNISQEGDYTVIRYIAKGGKEMEMPLNPKAEMALAEYLNECLERGWNMRAEDYIFRSASGAGVLDSKSVIYIIRKYARAAGVKGNITVHSARSTVIGMLLEQGNALERVADFVGHKDISMTKAYNKRRLKVHDSLSLKL